MSKAIYLSIHFHGHTNPVLPMIKELVKRGEEIIFYSHEEYRTLVEGTGAEFRNYNFDDKIPPSHKLTTIKAIKIFIEATLYVTDKFSEEIRQEKPEDKHRLFVKYFPIKKRNTLSSYSLFFRMARVNSI
ncbi:MAG: hypothetical protein ABUK01_11955 [Leptospirales bacterium]